jgi:putative transposase
VGEERELRLRAVELSLDGWKPTEIAVELGRSRQWVWKWLDRYRSEGADGLAGRSRRPHSSPARLGEGIRDEIVTVRRLLEMDRHANRDATAVQAEIERRAVIGEVPSLASIKRVLAAEGLTRPYRKRRRSMKATLGLPQVTEPGLWQQADWVQDRVLEGGIRFSSLQITDVGSHMLSTAQHRRRTVVAAAQQLTEQAWPVLSVPLAMSTDNAFSKTSHRDNPFTLWVRVLLMFGVEAIISPPYSFGFTNHVEAINGLWQRRTIDRHRYQSLEALQADNTMFLDWANTRRAVLDAQLCGTRYPVEYVAAHRQRLRWPPDGFTLEDYHQPDGPPLPLAKGRVTFLRYLSAGNTITIAQTRWPTPDALPVGSLTVATINTATAQLEIRHANQLIASHPYPITPASIDPVHPIPATGLLDHLPTMS